MFGNMAQLSCALLIALRRPIRRRPHLQVDAFRRQFHRARVAQDQLMPRRDAGDRRADAGNRVRILDESRDRRFQIAGRRCQLGGEIGVKAAVDYVLVGLRLRHAPQYRPA